MDVPSKLKRMLAPAVYRHPVSSLEPARFYAYLDELQAASRLPGDVLEVGCYLGGTAALASKFLVQIGSPRRYLCIDTFGGFVREQFSQDIEKGLPPADRGMFSGNSHTLARYLLDRWKAHDVETLQAEICTIRPELLPEHVAVALIDVDLAAPITCSLDVIYPRLVNGGVMLVDDCQPSTSWAGARPAYLAWVKSNGIEPEFRYGFGVVRKPA